MVVEDEDSLRGDLVEFLQDCGYDVNGYATAKDFFTEFYQKKPHIVLLDINLPDEDGYSIAEKIRSHSMGIGIIILTCRSALEDKLYGLNIGADAYLVKHTDLREIDATIRSLKRRLTTHDMPVVDQSTALTTDEIWSFDPARWRITSPKGKTTELTSTEYLLLSILMRSPGSVFSRDVISQNMNRPLREDTDRGIDAIIKRLRHKVEKNTGLALPISLVYGVGYAFTGKVRIEE